MWLEYLRIALSVLRGHKFRALLTVTSITIGSFSIVLMTSLAQSGSRTLFSGIEEIGGARMIRVFGKQPDSQEDKRISYGRGLTIQDAQSLSRIPHLSDMTAYASFWRRGLQADTGKQLSASVVGADARLLPFYRYQIAQGRMLDAEDFQDHGRVCVIGSDLADHLFGEGEAVVGHTVQLQFWNLTCRVVGRLVKLDRWGIGAGWDWDDVIFTPLSTLSDFKKKETDAGMRLVLRSDAQPNNEIVKRIMNATLSERHHGVDDFTIFDAGNIIGQFKQIFLIMNAIVAFLAGIALLVGGVGIMNIMLVSVSERVREIGIRKALGASPSDIGRQFLVEAVLLSTVGGVAGVVLGVIGALSGSEVIKHFKPRWLTTISHPAVLASLLLALLIGVVFGYFPARRASKLDPVAAIRT